MASSRCSRSPAHLLINPKILMLDEPTQGLAPVIVRELEGALLKLKGRFSMIIVEQNRSFLDVGFGQTDC